jgi:hypothetical protein
VVVCVCEECVVREFRYYKVVLKTRKISKKNLCSLLTICHAMSCWNLELGPELVPRTKTQWIGLVEPCMLV